MIKKFKESRGFTLIEVVIVLAIAALIILVVLQAVAAAQRSQRDTKRKGDAGRMSALLEQYSSNNRGIYPTQAQFNAAANTTGAFLSVYDAQLYAENWRHVAACTAPQASITREVIYTPGAGSRSYTLEVCLEAGGRAPITQ